MSFNYANEDRSVILERQRFLDSAIHHLRAPLRNIGTSAALLSQEWNDRSDEPTKARLAAILDGVQQIDNLAKSLADYSTAMLADGFLDSIPIESAVQSAMATLRKQIEKTGATVQYSGLPSLPGNHDQLSILFRCLLSNAIEHRGSSPPHIQISAVKTGDEWTFAVTDNGAGIAPTYHGLVFEPFQRLTSHHGGVGLCLTICKKIVAAHGGRIWVESDEGQGATFFFTLPA